MIVCFIDTEHVAFLGTDAAGDSLVLCVQRLPSGGGDGAYAALLRTVDGDERLTLSPTAPTPPPTPC